MNHGHDHLAGGGHEGLAGAIGFLDGEGPLVQFQPLRLDGIKQDGAGDAAQDGNQRQRVQGVRRRRGVYEVRV